MAELTKQESLERARKSIELAKERVNAINQRLPSLENELEELIVTNEIRGYKGRTIEKTQAEIEGLKKERETLQKTMQALTKKLPEIERAAQIEIASTEGLSAYRKAHSEFTELLSNPSSLKELSEAIEKTQGYVERLSTAKERFFKIGKKLFQFMEGEKIDLKGVNMQSLRDDRNAANVYYQGLLEMSDSLIEFKEIIHGLQFSLFDLSANPLEYSLPDPAPPKPEISPCGNYKIIFEDSSWCGYVKEVHFTNGATFDSWKRIRIADYKITFDELKKINDDMREQAKQRATEEALYEKSVYPFGR
jgi:hypothetical protein